MNINARLNTRDIDNLIRQLESFENELERKVEIFLSRLADVGIETAKVNTIVERDGQYVNMGDMIDFTKPIEGADGEYVCTLTATGQLYLKEWEGGAAEVNPLLMAEFGSGAKAVDGHRGTFPNQHVAFLSSWKWKDKAGQEHESSGNEPSRPMLKAAEEMRNQIQTIATEVFGT